MSPPDGPGAAGDVAAVVLAAGFGKRLRPLTDSVPKALVPFFGVPLLDHVLGRLARLADRPRRVVVNLHHLPDPIVAHVQDGRRHGLDVTYSHESPEILGTGGALRRLEPALAERFLVVNGDVWLEAPLDALQRAAADSTRGAAAIGLVRDPERPELNLVAVDPADGRIVAIGDRPAPAPTAGPRWIFAGAHVATRALFDVLPPNGFACVVRDGYVRLLAGGARLQGCSFPDAVWHDIGTPASYVRAHLDLFPRLAELVAALPDWPCRAVAPGVFLAPDAVIAGGAQLEPPVVVHAGARVERGATVGPCTVLAAGAVVRTGARAARSVVWEGTEVTGEFDRAVLAPFASILTDVPLNR